MYLSLTVEMGKYSLLNRGTNSFAEVNQEKVHVGLLFTGISFTHGLIEIC